jgi:hypothetical protein
MHASESTKADIKHTIEHPFDHGEDEEEKCCNLRVIGTTIFIVGSLFTFAAFSFGAQSLIAALESVQFVTNIIFVKYVHKQKVTTRMCLATLLIVAGNVVVVLFANHAAELFTSQEMEKLWRTNNIFHGYLAIAIVLFLVTFGLYLHYYNTRMVKRTLLPMHTFLEPFCYSVSAAIVGTFAGIHSFIDSLAVIAIILQSLSNSFAISLQSLCNRVAIA